MNTNYVIFDEDTPKSEQEEQIKILFNRVGLISKILYEKKPSSIPFNYEFPLIDINEQSVFLKECQKHHLFEDLPKHYQEKVYKAEKVNFYNQKFLEYLISQDMSEKEFNKKNPKTKLDIFYDFLFSNQMDVGMLEL